MNAATADAEPVRSAAAPAQARLALVGADSPELMSHLAMRTTGACGSACGRSFAPAYQPKQAGAAPMPEWPPQRTVWSPRGPASTALLTIGRPPRAVRV